MTMRILVLIDLHAHVSVAGVHDYLEHSVVFAASASVTSASSQRLATPSNARRLTNTSSAAILQRRSAIYLDASAGLGVMGRRNETVTAEMTNSPAMTVKAVW